MEATFTFRGLTFRPCGLVGLEILHEGVWYETDYMNRAALERQATEVPDVGLWGKGNTREYFGSARFHDNCSRQARRIEVEAAGDRAAKRHDTLRQRGLVRADGLI